MFRENLTFRPSPQYLTVDTTVDDLENVIESLALFRLERCPQGDANQGRYNWLCTRLDQMIGDMWLACRDICLLIWIAERLASNQLPLALDMVAGMKLGSGPPTGISPNITVADFEWEFPRDISRQLAFLNFVRNVIPLNFVGHSVLSWGCKLKIGHIQFGFSFGGGQHGRISLAPGDDPLAFYVARFLFMQMFTEHRLMTVGDRSRVWDILKNPDEKPFSDLLTNPPDAGPVVTVEQLLEVLPNMDIRRLLFLCLDKWIQVPGDPSLVLRILREDAPPGLQEKLFMLAMSLAWRIEGSFDLVVGFCHDPPAGWADLVHNKVLLDCNMVACVERAKKGCRSAIAKCMVFGENIVPYLDLDNDYHQYIKFVVLDEHLPKEVINTFYALELFLMVAREERIDEEKYKKIVTLATHFWLGPLLDVVDGMEDLCELIISGLIQTHVAMWKPPVEISQCIYEDLPKDNVCLTITIVWLAAHLVDNPACAPGFLDFYVSALSFKTFSQDFRGSVKQEELVANCMDHLQKAIKAGPQFVCDVLFVPPGLEPVVEEIVKGGCGMDMLCAIARSSPGVLRLLKTSQLDEFFSFLLTQANDVVAAIGNEMCEVDPDMVNRFYRAFTGFALTKPTAAREIFRKLSQSKECVREILSAIPWDVELSADFLLFLRDVVGSLPKTLYQMGSKPTMPHCCDSQWSEDTEGIAGEEPKNVSLWDDPEDVIPCTQLEHGHAYIPQPIFHCLTCKLVEGLGVCLGCAISCHKGHDLIYHGVSEWYCDCRENEYCKFLDASPADVVQENEERRPRQAVLSSRARETLNTFRFVSANGGGFGSGPSRFGTSTGAFGTSAFGTSGFGTTTGTFGSSSVGTSSAAGDVRLEQLKSDQAPLPLTLASDMLSNLCKEDLNFKRRSSIPLAELQLPALNPARPMQRLHFDLISDMCISSSKPLPHDETSLAQILGNNRDILVIAQQTRLATYSFPSLKPLSSVTLSSPARDIVVCPSDPQQMAIVSRKNVSVFVVESNGRLQSTAHISSEPTERRPRGPTGFSFSFSSQSDDIRCVDWVPLKRNHLAVTTSSYVKIYDLPVDCLSPCACYKLGAMISASCLFSHDEKIYLAVASDKQLSIHEVKEEAEWPYEIHKTVMFGDHFKMQGPRLSYSPETGLLFVDLGIGDLVVAHASAVANELEKAKITNFVKVSHRTLNRTIMPVFEFVCCVPEDKLIHMLKSVTTNEVYGLELSDQGLAFAAVRSPANGDDRCSLFSSNSDVYAMTSRDGQIFKLTPGMDSGATGPLAYITPDASADESEADTGEVQNGFEFHVSPYLWATAVRKDNEVILRCGSTNAQDLVTGRSQRFVPGSCISVIAKRKGFRICGIQVVCMECPGWYSLKVNNRLYLNEFGTGRTFAIPLKESEAKEGSIVRLHIDGLHPVVINRIEVYAIPVEEEDETEVFDWINDARVLTDFVDKPPAKTMGMSEFLVESLSAATFTVSDSAAERAAVHQMLCWMYERPRLAPFLRRMVLKTHSESEYLQEIWARAIQYVCVNHKVHKEMQKILWRDYSLLRRELRDSIAKDVWGNVAPCDFHGLVAALLG